LFQLFFLVYSSSSRSRRRGIKGLNLSFNFYDTGHWCDVLVVILLFLVVVLPLLLGAAAIAQAKGRGYHRRG
jgi:hypothetical protein